MSPSSIARLFHRRLAENSLDRCQMGLELLAIIVGQQETCRPTVREALREDQWHDVDAAANVCMNLAPSRLHPAHEVYQFTRHIRRVFRFPGKPQWSSLP